MEIIDYDSIYDEDIKDLLVELQEHIVEIDKDNYNIITSEYREKYFEETLSSVKKYDGKIFLAVLNNKACGLIVGLINNLEEMTYEFKAPKRGRISELVVSKKERSKGIGKMLLSHMENYFKSVGCKAVLISVFGYNDSAKNFYYSNEYSDRSIEVIKKI